MSLPRQMYACVTNAGWEIGLSTIWPDAPLVGEYRLLVFTNEDLPQLEKDYSSADFKYLSASETIEQMSIGVIGPFICDINQAREIVAHFTPVEESNP